MILHPRRLHRCFERHPVARHHVRCHCLQRHNRFGGAAVQYAQSTPGQPASPGASGTNRSQQRLMSPPGHNLYPAACGIGEHPEQCDPDGEPSCDDHLPNESLRAEYQRQQRQLQKVIGPAAGCYMFWQSSRSHDCDHSPISTRRSKRAIH